NWTPLGSGIGGLSSPSVFALTASGDDLYVGGNFITAGGRISVYFARAYLLPLPTLSVLRSTPNVIVSWPSPDTADFSLEQSATVSPAATWLPNSAPITDDGTNKSITFPATNSPQFFRLRRP